MAVITLKISHLCTFTFTLLILHTATHVIDTIPLCGSMDGSAPKDSDKIVFKDNQGIRTVEVNGTVVACYPDGTPVNMNSSSSSSDEEEVLRGAKLVSRIREGNLYDCYWKKINANAFLLYLFILMILMQFS